MTRATLLALAARVEAAKGADRALDLAVCRVALNSEPLGHAAGMSDDLLLSGYGLSNPSPRYTASIDAAASLVPKGWAYCVDNNEGGYATVHPVRPLGYLSSDPWAEAATPALALTAAAIRAAAKEIKGCEHCDSAGRCTYACGETL